MINLDNNCLTLFRWDISVPNEMYTGVNMHKLLREIYKELYKEENS